MFIDAHRCADKRTLLLAERARLCAARANVNVIPCGSSEEQLTLVISIIDDALAGRVARCQHRLDKLEEELADMRSELAVVGALFRGSPERGTTGEALAYALFNKPRETWST